MHRAYEVAFCAAFMFGGSRPRFSEIDEVGWICGNVSVARSLAGCFVCLVQSALCETRRSRRLEPVRGLGEGVWKGTSERVSVRPIHSLSFFFFFFLCRRPHYRRLLLHAKDTYFPRNTFRGRRLEDVFSSCCRPQVLEKVPAISVPSSAYRCSFVGCFACNTVDEQVVFLQPVDVGDLVKLDACVLYTKEG